MRTRARCCWGGWGDDLSMHRDWMPADPPYVPQPGGTRMPRGWDPED